MVFLDNDAKQDIFEVSEARQLAPLLLPLIYSRTHLTCCNCAHAELLLRRNSQNVLKLLLDLFPPTAHIQNLIARASAVQLAFDYAFGLPVFA